MRDCVYSLNNCVYTNESVTGPEMHQEFVMSIYGLNLLAASVWNRHRHSSLDTGGDGTGAPVVVLVETKDRSCVFDSNRELRATDELKLETLYKHKD
jgi:hypothetical protein